MSDADVGPGRSSEPPAQHPSAVVDSQRLGAGTRVSAFCRVQATAVIGANCFLGEGALVEDGVCLGDRVTVHSGARLHAGLRVEDDVVIGCNAAFPNDSFTGAPNARPTIVRRGALIGANATVLPGANIGQHAVVGAGAVVTRSVPPHAIVVGNPARILRYNSSLQAGSGGTAGSPMPCPEPSAVAGVSLERVEVIKDVRGNLIAREIGRGLPFAPQRCFVVLDVPGKELRGAHAHRHCQQLLVCLRGSLSVVADDGTNLREFVLDRPELALYLPPMIWSIQYKYSSDAMLLVLASEPYAAEDYIRDYDEFLRQRVRLDGPGRHA